MAGRGFTGRGLPPGFDAYCERRRRAHELGTQMRQRQRQARRHDPMGANHWTRSEEITGYVLVKNLVKGGLSEAVKVVRHRRTLDLRVLKRVGQKARPKQELEILKRIPKHCNLNYMVSRRERVMALLMVVKHAQLHITNSQ